MENDFLVFGKPLISEEDIKEVVDCLKSGWIGTGPRVKHFEEMFREYKGVKHAAAVNSCTAALHLVLEAIGIGNGEEVIVPSMTFAATANAVIHAGARPVLADVDKNTMNIDIGDIKRKITAKTKAVIPVHFAGRPCDMDGIIDVSKKNNLKIIEDSAHALEAEYHGRKTGTMGDAGCFSFYATKNVITGEGGMVITANEEYARKVKIMSLHGMSSDAWERTDSTSGAGHYDVVYPGYKFNMTDLQASLGMHQFSKIDEYHKKRRDIWEKYNESFSALPVFTPKEAGSGIKHSYHLYTLLLDIDKTDITRDEFIMEMKKRKIGVGVHYRALHLHPYYRLTFGCKKGDFPNAEWISERTVSLPLSPSLTDENVQSVITAVKDVLK
jgi:dTDP-4-amino-4,6-dideoxygalactose transaminase